MTDTPQTLALAAYDAARAAAVTIAAAYDAAYDAYKEADTVVTAAAVRKHDAAAAYDAMQMLLSVTRIAYYNTVKEA
jgi:hypothetical protein